MPSLQSRRSLAMLFVGWPLIYGLSLSIMLLPLPTVTAVGGVEMLDHGRADAQKEEILLDKKLKEAFDLAQRTLGEYNNAKLKLLSVTNNIVESKEKKDGLGGKIKEIEDMKEQVTNKTEQIDKRIRDINAQQILDLKGKVEKVRDRELQRREKLKEKEEKDKKRQRKLEMKRKKKQMMKKKKKIPDGALKKGELQDLVDVKAIVRESDEKLEDWCVQMVADEVASLQEELEEHVVESTKALGKLGNEARKGIEKSSGDDCSGASLVEAVELVQESLVKYSHDVVGMADHLEKATIVHFLTSENYFPESKHHNPLEEMAWFQYLPDDWERGLDAVLPKGWRQWNVAIPDYVYHTFGLNKYAATAPPEAILTPHLYPGACWPMEGTSGQVTLRLPYPVKVTAVTLDHAPASLFEEEEERNSAPKKVRVFGYPPCWIPQVATGSTESGRDSLKDDYLDESTDSDDDEVDHVRGLCADGLDFDVQKPIVLHDFEYNMTGPSIQTFHIPMADEEEEEDDEGSCSEDTGTCGGNFDDGSCSEDTGTCGGSLDGGANAMLFSSPERSEWIEEGVSAIRLQVIDNWGNADYTCIYRFRVHGDAIDPSEG